LNSEVDRLEAALAEAKLTGARKRSGDSKQGADAAAHAEALEETFAKAKDAWEAERGQLKSQINGLEANVAEVIERSANPMRATQSVREQFEVELSKLAAEKTETEQAYLRLKTEHEQYKLKTTGELVKLRRAAQIMGRPVPKEDAPEANPRIRDIETQFQDAAAKWNTEREKLVTEIQKLESVARQWDTERRQLNDHAGQLQQAFVQAQARIQGYEAAQQSVSQKDVGRLEELQRQKQSLERELQDARNTSEDERRRLNAQTERLEQQLQRMSDTRQRVSDEVVDQLRKQYDQKLQEAIQQKTQLALELQAASALLESERARLSAKLAEPSKGADHKGTIATEAISAEISRVEALISEIVAVIDNPETELSTVIRKNVEKAELDSYLKGILFSMGRKHEA
jgi:hypothetical protein